MHARLIVLVDKKEGDSSASVRSSVTQKLDSSGFAGEGSIFCSSPADWFVIGGRWSGELTWWRLGKANEDKFYEEGQRRSLVETQDPIKLFNEMFPDFQGLVPAGRDTYSGCGYDDDAQILDKVLFEALKMLKRFPDDGDLSNGDCYVDLDEPYNEVTPDAIGKKWCVLVDFHY